MIPARQLLLILGLILLPAAAHAQDGWYLFRADAQRSNAASKAPLWDKRVPWQRPLLMDKLDGLPDADEEQAAKDLIDKLYKEADKSLLPGSFPLIVNGSCVYRSYAGVCCVGLQDIHLKDFETNAITTIKPREFHWKSIPHSASVAILLNKNQIRSAVMSAVEVLREKKQGHYVWANATIGSPSSNGKLIFMIDDFAYPELDLTQKPELRALAGSLDIHNTRIKGNSLIAYDGLTGKFTWDTDKCLRKSFVLGAPLPLGDKLFLLNEKNDELRLSVIDLNAKKAMMVGTPDIEKSLPIATIPAKEQILKHPLRRAQALHIAQAGDLLICPTNAGTLVGVDRAKFAVRWTYRYREEGTPAPALPLWQAACPVLFKDRIVFTAADAPQIHCLDLNGKQKWVTKADKDLYLGTVHTDLVLLVGKTHCRALSLADGSEKWRLETGLPAGVGVRDGELFYLPLRHEAGTMKPAIWAIDLTKGMKTHRLAAPYPDALGNLALHRGLFVSQSVTHIAAFPLKLLPPK